MGSNESYGLSSVFWMMVVILVVCTIVYYRFQSPRFLSVMKWIFGMIAIILILFIVLWYCLGLNLWLYPKKYLIGHWKRIEIQDGLTLVDTKHHSSDPNNENIIIYVPGINPPHEIVWSSPSKHDMVAQLHEKGHYRTFIIEHRFAWLKNNENLRVEDLQLVWNYLTNRFPHSKIVVIGNSYGATVLVKWTLRQVWLTGKHPQLQGIVLLNMTVCFKDALSRFLLPNWMGKRIKQSTLEDIALNRLDMNEVILKTCSQDINSLLPMNLLAGQVPIVMVYLGSGDPLVDAQMWDAWLEEHSHHTDVNGIPAIQGIKLRNRKQLKGIAAHCKTQFEDRRDWFPALNRLFQN